LAALLVAIPTSGQTCRALCPIFRPNRELRAAEVFLMCCWIEGLKEHRVPMFTADRLSMAPFHSETRRTCDIPMVIVSSKLEVAQIGRVVLRTAIY